MSQPWLIRSEMQPAFDGGFIQSKFLIGGIFVVANKAQRNAIHLLNRRLDATTGTLVIVTSENRIYQLINNPSTITTQDTDWATFFIGQTSSFRPVGVWDADNDDVILQDLGAVNRNGEFYFVTNAPTQRTIQYDGLFGNATESVTNGDLVVSIGDKWVVITSSVQWETLNKPQSITDYTNGIVIHHTHPISDITGLVDALDAKYDSGDAAPINIAFASVSDTAIIQTQFLRTWYYNIPQIDEMFTHYYTKSEVDSLVSGASIHLNDGSGMTWNASTQAYDLGGTATGNVTVDVEGHSIVFTGTAASKTNSIGFNNSGGVSVYSSGSTNEINLYATNGTAHSSIDLSSGGVNIDAPKLELVGVAATIPTDASLVTRAYVLGAKTFAGKQTFTLAPQFTTSSVAGYVWTATDSAGNGSWQVPTGGGGGGGNVTGSGAVTQLAIWSSATGIIGDTQLIYDSANNILSTDRFHYNALSADPSTPAAGDLIYQSTLVDFRGYVNGQWINLTRPEVIIDNASTTITLDESYRNKKLYLGAATSITVNAGNISVGFTVKIFKTGTGNITFTPTGGTSLDGTGTITIVNNGATYTQKSASKWHVEGEFNGTFPSNTFGANISVVLNTGDTFGRFKNGDTISSLGKTAEQVVIDACTAYIQPVFTSIGVTGQATTVELGTTLSGAKTVTWSMTLGSATVSTVDIYDNTASATLLAGTPNDNTQSVTITTIQLNTDGASQSWKVIGNNTSPVGTFSSPNFTVTARSKYFAGVAGSRPNNSATVRALPVTGFQTSGNQFTIPTGTSATKIYVSILSTYSLTSVKDTTNGNLDITGFFTNVGSVSVNDAGGTARTYTLYAYEFSIPYGTNSNLLVTTT